MRDRLLAYSILLGMALLCGVPSCSMYQMARQMDYRANERPPAETFRRLLGAPPPGVSDVRATGYMTIPGSRVWLRLRATDAAVAAVTRGYSRLKADEAQRATTTLLELSPGDDPLNTQPHLPLEHRVYWEELGRVRMPEVYMKSEEGGTRHTLIVDRKRRLVYLYYWSQ